MTTSQHRYFEKRLKNLKYLRLTDNSTELSSKLILSSGLLQSTSVNKIKAELLIKEHLIFAKRIINEFIKQGSKYVDFQLVINPIKREVFNEQVEEVIRSLILCQTDMAKQVCSDSNCYVILFFAIGLPANEEHEPSLRLHCLLNNIYPVKFNKDNVIKISTDKYDKRSLLKIRR